MEHDIRDAPHEFRDPPAESGARVKRVLFWVVPLLAVALVAAYLLRPESPPPPPVAPAATPAPPVAQAPAEPEVKHPIEAARPEIAEPIPATPLPALDESDRAVAEGLASLANAGALDQFVSSSGFIRRVVATVDNLPRQKAPVRAWPVKPTAGAFATSGEGAEVVLDARNYQRYEPFLRLVESVDTGRAVALYVRFYPLFQQAYRELGYPRGQFNDRLVEVIDHLLATPEVAGPIKLAKPWVMWEFADPALAARSAGQKTLIRMGPENAQRAKAKLREVRRQVTGARPAS
jgi:hypothetical protein